MRRPESYSYEFADEKIVFDDKDFTVVHEEFPLKIYGSKFPLPDLYFDDVRFAAEKAQCGI
jgi:hypothetical protein